MMYYETHEVAALLKGSYKSPRTFLAAIRSKERRLTSPLLCELWEARIAAKIGRNILWPKQKIDNILKTLQ